MPTNTTTYNFIKPTVGGDTDVWGGYLNSNWDDVDNLLDGTTPVTGIDINSGSIDGTAIGATTPSTGAFTTLSTTGATTLAGLSITGTEAITIPVGTTAQRPTPSQGMIRYNTTNSGFEGYNGSSWGSLGGGATGGVGDQVFIENDITVTQDYTITTNKNAGSFGPIIVDTGVTVTIPSGSVWSIV